MLIVPPFGRGPASSAAAEDGTQLTMNFSVYILKSQKDNSYYIGVTNNLARRISEHQKCLSKSTKNKTPWHLVYQEDFDTIKSAYQREKEIKSRKKRKYIEGLVMCARSSAG